MTRIGEAVSAPRFPALIAGLIAIAVTAACTVGPNYKRPAVVVPDTYRGAAQAAPATAASSIGDEQWSAIFADEPLRELIRTAIANNYDLRIAAARILQTEAQYGIARSEQFPTVNGNVGAQGQHGAIAGGFVLPTVGFGQINASASWEIDFWGKYRRATEGARAQILASQWGQRVVVTRLIGELATGYYNLRALDLQLEIAKRTLESRKDSLRLTIVREEGGATSRVDVHQAEQLVHTAEGEIVDLTRQIEQTENGLAFLSGQNPGPIARGRALTEQTHAPAIPAGLPSDLLERRPDIQQAEQLMVSANAQIGVAKAAYFPQISLTGSGGVASSALSSLFTTGTWNVAAGAVQPIFNANRTKSRVALAEAQTLEASLVYRQTIQPAFREVPEALVGFDRSRELRVTRQALVESAREARRLVDIRYQGGASSYLEVLDSDTRLFDAELQLVGAQLSELSAFVDVYRALGGGWRS